MSIPGDVASRSLERAGTQVELHPDLLRQCREGSEAAWVELYRQQKGRVTRFLRYLLGPIDDIDDLVQQVFLETVRSLDTFRGDARLSTWLFAISRHVAELHLRSHWRRQRRNQARRLWEEAADRFAPDPADSGDDRLALRLVQRTLDGMDQRYRLAWLLVESEGMTSDQAAGALGVPAGTVRSRLWHARGRILDALQNAGLAAGVAADPPEPGDGF